MEKTAMRSKIINFVRKNKKELVLLILILLAGAFFRLYRISSYMTFLGDEGRDVIIVRRFLTELHPPLIGPGTSVGNMYLGPIYYYMMAPALLIANFSPVGPAIQVALLGVVTIAFIWWVGRVWFGRLAGIIAAGLYAISPVVIYYSRSSWNPNIMPFFSLLSIYSIWKVYKEHKFNYLIVLGISFAFVLQSHYLGLLLLPTILIFWFLTIKDLRMKSVTQLFENCKLIIDNFLKKSGLGLLIFSGLMSPLLFFDIRHGWTNIRAVEAFIINGKDVGFSLIASLSKVGSVAFMIASDLISAKNIYLSFITLALFLSVLIWKFKNKNTKDPLSLILLWLAVGIVGVLFYKGPIYDHYLGFLFPAPFLLLGAAAQNVRKYKILSLIFGAYFLFLVLVNLVKSPVLSDPTFQMQRAMSVAKVIQEKANGERFNLATISDLNNRDVYQYFLTVWGAKVVDTNPSSLNFTVTDQLFVVCELPREKCDPVHNPSVWITNFGWTKITDEWPVWGGTLFKLGHNK